jgi:hypothetical protein
MSEKTYGKKVWFFPDGDIPAPGNQEPFGHESLVILNPNDKDAAITITVYYVDKEPENIENLNVSARRVRCFRTNEPLGEKRYQIPFGQYALKIESNVGIVCQIGRMDVQQPNLAYYTTMGYAG